MKSTRSSWLSVVQVLFLIVGISLQVIGFATQQWWMVWAGTTWILSAQW